MITWSADKAKGGHRDAVTVIQRKNMLRHQALSAKIKLMYIENKAAFSDEWSMHELHIAKLAMYLTLIKENNQIGHSL